MRGKILNTILSNQQKTVKENALDLRAEMNVQNKKKRRFNFKVGLKDHSVLLNFDQIVNNNREAKKMNLSIEKYLEYKYSPISKRKTERDAKQKTYKEFKSDVISWLRENKITLSFIKDLQRGEARQKQLRTIITLRNKFGEIKDLAKVLKVSTHKIYRAKCK